jgi:hypothetical protein
MKKWIAAGIAATMLAGCTSRTPYGECVGVATPRSPHLEYRLNAWNVALGVIFFQTVFVPLVVLLDEMYCPVAVKPLEEPKKIDPLQGGTPG